VEHAQWLGAVGFRVFPLFPLRANVCTCRSGASCSGPGKHPRITKYLDEATGDPEVIQLWWTRWPDAGIGGTGIPAVDVDPRNQGDLHLVELERTNEPLPITWESATGGGGRHRFFKHPLRVVSSTTLAKGVDFKADRGFVVLPPSQHVSGQAYQWVPGRSPAEAPLAPLPAWVENTGKRGRSAQPRRLQYFRSLWAELGVEVRSGSHHYLCPLHDDHHSSLSIDAEACLWQCFGCLRSGRIGKLRALVAEKKWGEWMRADARAWSTRRGATAYSVLRGYASFAMEKGKLTPEPRSQPFHPGDREVAERAGVSVKTVQRHRSTLMELGWLKQVGHRYVRPLATVYELRVPGRIQAVVSPRPWGRGNALGDRTVNEGQDLWRYRGKTTDGSMSYGLGKSCQRVYEALSATPTQLASLAQMLQLKPYLLKPRLQKLARYGLAAERDGEWLRGGRTEREVATELGVVGLGEAQGRRHVMEREAYHDYLQEVDGVDNPFTGEVWPRGGDGNTA
jgi:hypothetical protein